jgi:hypothetical protein
MLRLLLLFPPASLFHLFGMPFDGKIGYSADIKAYAGIIAIAGSPCNPWLMGGSEA